MKFRLIQTIVALSVILSSCGGDDDGSPMTGGDDGEPPITASYTATITTQFTEETFPDDYPDNPTFGTIVAITHAPEISVFNIGELASDGFKSYVEDNDVEALVSFINGQLEEEDEGDFDFQTEGTIAAEGSKTFNVSFTPTRTRLTIIANLSPSPDWFVGVSSFDIVDGEILIDNATIGLRAIDGGVSAGATYDSPDEAENAVISLINTLPFSTGGPSPGLGSIELQRID